MVGAVQGDGTPKLWGSCGAIRYAEETLACNTDKSLIRPKFLVLKITS